MTKQEKKGKTPLIRPVIHFTDTNWINDPCAPGYDPNAGTYHLFYQCMGDSLFTIFRESYD